MATIEAKLLDIQQTISVPKTLKSENGDYKYRSAEQILELLHPLLKEKGCIIILTDDVRSIGGYQYVSATATLIDTETKESISASASAREKAISPNLDDAQLTGVASSYARKYALCGLLAISSGQDADQLSTSPIAADSMSEEALREVEVTVGLSAGRKLGEVFEACKKANSANALYWIAKNDLQAGPYAREFVRLHPELMSMV